MKASELWIGDKVLLRSSGRTGTYEGTNRAGKLRVKINDKIILTKSGNIEVIPEDYDNSYEDLSIEDEIVSGLDNSFPKNSIDLHLHILDPEQRVPGIRALDFQLAKCKDFIESAIYAKKNIITIIHGKGTGLLKSSIYHLLEEYNQVYLKLDVNNGGATEVWLQY